MTTTPCELYIVEDSTPLLTSSASSYDSMIESLNDEMNTALDLEFISIECSNDMVSAMMYDYESNYTIKQLKHIIGYYGIKSKTKKSDIVQDIILFETNPINTETVLRRKQLFCYIDVLKNDGYLKDYIII